MGAATSVRSPAEVLRSLGVDPTKGLSAAEARNRLEKYGPNALVGKKQSQVAVFLHRPAGPKSVAARA
jgi:Cation transporter/ATPase, N-terminus